MIKKLTNRFFTLIPENNQLERIWILAKTDFSQRYFGTKLGIVWAFLNPLFQITIYYIVFTYLFHVTIENFVLYVFSGFLIIFFFNESTVKGMFTLKTNLYLIENIRFNPINIYIALVLSTFYGFIFNFLVYFLISFIFPVTYSWNVLFFPLLIVNLIIIILSINLLLSTLYIYLRDINHLWDVVLLVVFWSCPIFYDKDILMDRFEFVLYVNPVSGIMINVREVLLYNRLPDFNIFFYDFLYAFILLFISILIFKKFSTKAVELL